MNKSISRKNLKRHKIYYEPSVYESSHRKTQSVAYTLPDHVDALRDGLLSLEKILPKDCDAILREELVEHGDADIGPDWCLDPQPHAFITLGYFERLQQNSASHDNLRLCEQLSRRAQEIHEDSEPEWTLFWRSKIFTLFSDEAREQSGFR